MSGLAFCLVALSFGAGCSKDVVKETEREKRWACDKEADEAMLRQDYEGSILLHQRFLQEKPGNGLAMYHLGFAYGQIEDHMNEVSYYEKAISLGFNRNHIFFNLGMAYGELNQTDNSIRAFEKALNNDPGNLDARLHLSMLYADMGDMQKAREQLHRILEMDPTHAQARQLLESMENGKGGVHK